MGEHNKIKRRNRAYLKRVFTLKSVFYPVLLLLYRSGAPKYAEKIINKITSAAGIKKNIHFFFKYIDYATWFKNSFRPVQAEKGEIVFPMMAGVNGNFTLLNLLFSKYFLRKDKLKPIFFVCDAAIEICTKDGLLKPRSNNPWFCHECWNGYKHIESETGIEILKITELSSEEGDIINDEFLKIENMISLDACYDYSFEGIPVGRFIKKSVLRYFLKGSLEGLESEVYICRKFLKSNVVYAIGFKRLLDSHKNIRYAIINNGTLSFESVARFLCNERGIEYMTYETFLGNNSLIYKKNGEVMNLDWEKEYACMKETLDVTDKITETIENFFFDLKKGIQMYAVLNKEHSSEKMAGINRYACLFTNLNFDTAVLDRNTIFNNMEDWIKSVINYWKKEVSGIALIIRIHPGEVKLVTATREFLGDRIRKESGNDPSVMIFDSDEKVNSYELIKGMEFGLVYSSTIGLEIAWSGKTCLVAGMPWFRNKPFVILPSDRDEYFDIVGQLTRGNDDFIPDRQELIRTMYFTYFQRIKRLNGIKLHTPREEPNSEFIDPDEMISANYSFFEEFRDELVNG